MIELSSLKLGAFAIESIECAATLVKRMSEYQTPHRGKSEWEELIDRFLNRIPGPSVGQRVCYEPPFGIWFRGEVSKEIDPRPSIFRDNNDITDLPMPYFDETSITHHFAIRAPEQRQNCRNSFDWLCLMRHYGLPTRLLDWSENFLVALYFATQKAQVKELEGNDHDARLWILNTQKLSVCANKHSLPPPKTRKPPYSLKKVRLQLRSGIAVPCSIRTAVRAGMTGSRDFDDFYDQVFSFNRDFLEDAATFESFWKPQFNNPSTRKQTLDHFATPCPVYPNRLNERLLLQQSVFTVHGGKRYSKDETLPLELRLPKPIHLTYLSKQIPTKDLASDFLMCVDIPRECKDMIQKQLRFLGIHEGSLYPELDKQSEYLKAVWSRKQK